MATLGSARMSPCPACLAVTSALDDAALLPPETGAIHCGAQGHAVVVGLWFMAMRPTVLSAFGWFPIVL